MHAYQNKSRLMIVSESQGQEEAVTSEWVIYKKHH